MIEIEEETKVGEFVLNNPGAKAVFERLGIDYCCGGKKKLLNVARAQGIDKPALEKMLAQEPPPGEASQRDWAAAPVHELVAHILDAHHAYMKRELPRLSGLLAKVSTKHSERHGTFLSALEAVYAPLRREMEAHMMKEERILFPMILDLDRLTREGGGRPEFHCGSVDNPIRQMMVEHDGAGAAFLEMRRLSGGYAPPADACPSFASLLEGLRAMEADLHEHVHLENNALFPKASALEAGLS